MRFLYFILLFALFDMSAFGSNAVNEATSIIENIDVKDKYVIEKIFSEIKIGNREKHLSLMQDLFLSPEKLLKNKDHLELVKVEAADVLAQAYRNNEFDETQLLNQIYAYAKENVSADDNLISQTSINIVGIFDRKDGFELLLNVLEEQNSVTFSAAALAVVTMCSSYDAKSLDKVLQNVSKGNRNNVIDMNERIGKNIRASGWCARSTGH